MRENAKIPGYTASTVACPLAPFGVFPPRAAAAAVRTCLALRPFHSVHTSPLSRTSILQSRRIARARARDFLSRVPWKTIKPATTLWGSGNRGVFGFSFDLEMMESRVALERAKPNSPDTVVFSFFFVKIWL